MKGQWMKGGRIIAILFATAALGAAQSNTSVQSENTMPPPGTLNYVEGQVSLNNSPLTPNAVRTSVIQPGQTIATGEGYAEVLLTPGAFLRIGHNSQARFLSAGLVTTRVELDHGSAMIEVADLVKGTDIGVVMNGANTLVEKKGLYAFDSNGQAVEVLDGEAKVSE